MISMKPKIFGILFGLAFLGVAGTTMAQGTLTITGTGSGTLNGSSFSNDSFIWTLNYSTSNPYLGWGANQPVYTVSSSQLTLDGTPLTVSVTGASSASGLWYDWDASSLSLAPMFGNPGGNILTIISGEGWDGASDYSSTSIGYASFSQFYNLATDQGALTMSSGNVSSLAIAGYVPEPSTLALTILAGTALLRFWRRK